ncbi:(d)CMP kinase [Saccharicrinis sp. FJH54]|uniref:(d)CMP kinase n=1 Tax=Saccharicrinis sp. FJH54 TaxID=3344665 RepID=UPI0035D49B91
MSRKIIIAIDGYSSCGKSTLAKDLAKELGYVYVDSGAMYRAVTLYCIDNHIIQDGNLHAESLKFAMHDIQVGFRYDPLHNENITLLNGKDVEKEIRSMEVSRFVSQVSALKYVREAMVHLQRQIGKEKGIVMDGRDIGTVVFPKAELKIFLVAKPEIRAKRRFDELKSKGYEVSIKEIVENINHRDQYDTSRAESPLRKALDAIELDNSFLNPGQQLERVLSIARKKIADGVQN